MNIKDRVSDAIRLIFTLRFLCKLIGVCIMVVLIDTFTALPNVFVPALAILIVLIIDGIIGEGGTSNE